MIGGREMMNKFFRKCNPNVPINDNNPHEYSDNEGWQILFSSPIDFEPDFKNEMLVKAFESHFDIHSRQSLENFLWFIRFEYSFRQQDVQNRRKSLKIVKEGEWHNYV
jgi:hypothetical protein